MLRVMRPDVLIHLDQRSHIVEKINGLGHCL